MINTETLDIIKFLRNYGKTIMGYKLYLNITCTNTTESVTENIGGG